MLLEEHLRIKGRTTWCEILEEMQKDLDGYLETYNPWRPRHEGQDALRRLQGRDPEEAVHPEALNPEGGQGRSVDLTSARPGVKCLPYLYTRSLAVTEPSACIRAT